MSSLDLNESEQTILKILAEQNTISVAKASEQLGVSSVTTRKIFSILEAKGMIIRTHGGASLAFHPDISLRQSLFIGEKTRIAERAADLVKSNDSIMINATTTGALICKFLKDRSNVNVITNSTLLVPYAKANPSLNVILLGGMLHPHTEAIVGSTAIRELDSYYAKLAFIGTAGFSDASGVTAHIYDESEVPQKMVKRSEKSVLLTDSSKWNKCSLIKMMELRDVDVIITDSALPLDAQRKIRDLGVELILA
jgi:DeoR/GlpR family transcriptional regulator of sugar metabolism